MFCGSASLVNYGLSKVRARVLRCRAWSCDMCLPLRRNRLVQDVVDGAPTKFLTLTGKFVEGGDPVAAAKRQGSAFAALIRQIKKTWPSEDFAYFVVREGTKNGWPHLHVALRSGYISQKWISKVWEGLTAAPGVDIRPIRGAKGAAKYLAKYIGKNPMRFGTTKRYWHSKNWFAPRAARKVVDRGWNSKWHIVHERTFALAQDYWLRGWTFRMTGEFGYFEARAPP